MPKAMFSAHALFGISKSRWALPGKDTQLKKKYLVMPHDRLYICTIALRPFALALTSVVVSKKLFICALNFHQQHHTQILYDI